MLFIFVKEQSSASDSFVIDMINGFVRRGALHDPAIAQAAQPIKDLIELLECRTVFVADSHPPKTREFLSYPGTPV